MTERTLKECPVCRGFLARSVDLGVASLWRCRACGLIEASVSSNDRKEYYSSGYEGLYEDYYRPFRERQFKEALSKLEGLGCAPGRVLDVGCSYGWFLKEATRRGWEAVGAEPSPKVFKSISGDKDKRVYNCGVSGLNSIDGEFDLVTMWNVFEHLDDPRASLKAVCGKLKKGGSLLICVPDSKGLITKASFAAYRLSFGRVRDHLVRLYQLDNDFPHLYHYSRKNLESLMRSSGIEPYASWGQDIVDESNLSRRIQAYAGNGIGSGKLMALGLVTLQRLSRLLGMEDERVVVARKA